MKTAKRILAALLVAVMSVALFSSTAFAASKTSASDKAVAKAKKTLESLDTDKLYSGTIEDPTLIYYGSQPFTQPFSVLRWAMSDNLRNKPDFKGSIQDLSVGIVSDLAGFYAKNYLSKTITTLQDATKDIADGLKNGPDEIVNSVAKYVPIASDLYKLSGPAGKLTMQAFLLPGYLATNAGALAFVIVGGSAALVVIFGLTGILSPLLALDQGPLYIEQFFRDLNEMERAILAQQ